MKLEQKCATFSLMPAELKAYILNTAETKIMRYMDVFMG